MLNDVEKYSFTRLALVDLSTTISPTAFFRMPTPDDECIFYSHNDRMRPDSISKWFVVLLIFCNQKLIFCTEQPGSSKDLYPVATFSSYKLSNICAFYSKHDGYDEETFLTFLDFESHLLRVFRGTNSSVALHRGDKNFNHTSLSRWNTLMSE